MINQKIFAKKRTNSDTATVSMPILPDDFDLTKDDQIVIKSEIPGFNDIYSRKVQLRQVFGELKTLPLPLGILPLAVRYISPTQDLFVIERPPRIATIRYSPYTKLSLEDLNAREDIEEHTYDIPLPWTLTCIRFSSVRIYPYVSLRDISILGIQEPIPLDGMNHPVYSIPLPNKMNSSLCFGTEYSHSYMSRLFRQEDMTVSKVLNELINLPWLGRFNNDANTSIYLSELPTFLREKILSVQSDKKSHVSWSKLFDEWQNFSLEDVHDWDAKPWDRYRADPHSDLPKLAEGEPVTFNRVLRTLESKTERRSVPNSFDHPLIYFYSKLMKALTNYTM